MYTPNHIHYYINDDSTLIIRYHSKVNFVIQIRDNDCIFNPE